MELISLLWIRAEADFWWYGSSGFNEEDIKTAAFFIVSEFIWMSYQHSTNIHHSITTGLGNITWGPSHSVHTLFRRPSALLVAPATTEAWGGLFV
jgi:hypothetical protein